MAIVLTPAPVQGQPYQVRAGAVVTLELSQFTFRCSSVTIVAARWESTAPTVATIAGIAPTSPGEPFRARLVAVRPGETTLRAFYTHGGRESEATGAQTVFVVP